MIGYKIFDLHTDGTLLTLFHGINKSRKMCRNQWITATKEIVSDSSRGSTYTSGFHFLPTYEEAEDYLTCFSKATIDKKIIIKCLFEGVYPKAHSRSNVFLARQMFIMR